MSEKQPRKGEIIMAINDISLTSGMRSNLLSLQNTVSLLDRTQERLATGKKVNSAIDNPVSYFASESLTARASSIDSLKDSMGQAVSTISAANEGITSISALIEQAKGIAQSALSTQMTPDAIVDGAATKSITYATVTMDVSGVQATQTVTVDGQTFIEGSGWDGTAADLAADINANTTLTGLGYSAAVVDGKVVVSISGADVDIDDISATVTGYVETPNAHSETWSITADGTQYTGTGATAAAAASDLQTNLLAGTNVATATVTAANVVNVTFDPGTDESFASLVSQYNTILTQLTALAEDSGYKGKNLLSSDTLTVKFEGADLAVVGFDASATGLQIGTATWASETDITTSINELDNAFDTLRSESSKLSGNLSIVTVRQDFSTKMINTLTEGADKLTLADSNEEGANMLMLQTRQSLSTTALSLSAQAAQSVLQLFR
jgi:flagellin-like hook-associated protein FlgL